MSKIKIGNKYLASNGIAWTVVSINKLLRIAKCHSDKKLLGDDWPFTFKEINKMKLVK
jgi:hypothetical protein